MNERELKLELESVLYSWGKSLCGSDRHGGMIINSLLKRRGLRATHMVLKTAAAKSDPKEYISACLREDTQKINDGVAIGTRMGKYVWNGHRWAEVEGVTGGVNTT